MNLTPNSYNLPQLLERKLITRAQYKRAEDLNPDSIAMNENSVWLICYCGREVTVLNEYGVTQMNYPMKEPWVRIEELEHASG